MNARESLIPFSAPSDPDEVEYTTAGRQSCPSCGEWVYPRRPVGSQRPFAFAPECVVCGKPFPEDE